MFSGCPSVRCPLTCIPRYLFAWWRHSILNGTSFRHVNGRGYKGFQGHGVKVKVAETFAGEGIQIDGKNK